MTSRSKATRKDGPSGRFYEVEGKLLPSVTHILQVIAKPALVAWAAKEERILAMDCCADLYESLALAAQLSRPMIRSVFLATLDKRIGSERAHKKQAAKATEIGSAVHNAIEWELRKELGQESSPPPKLNAAAALALASWQAWRRTVDLKPIAIEQTVWSVARGYAGTLDLLCEIAGEKCVIDWKTAKAIYAEAHLQTAAYRAAVTEMGHGPCERAFVVRLPKTESDPDFEVAESPSVESLLPTFDAAVALWRWWYRADQESKEQWKARKAASEAAR